MAALNTLRTVIKEESNLIIQTTSECISSAATSGGSVGVKEMVVKESPMVIARVEGMGVRGVGGIVEEGLTGGRHLRESRYPSAERKAYTTCTILARTNLSQHLDLIKPPNLPISSPLNSATMPNMPHPHSPILSSLSNTTNATSQNSSKILSGGVREAIENAIQTGVQENVELLADNKQVWAELEKELAL